ncbi:hypothetical protein GCM10027040_16760 [Halomonas shantousis]
MTGLEQRGPRECRAPCHDGAETLPICPATGLTNRTPAWMLAPRGVRRPYLTDPPACND